MNHLKLYHLDFSKWIRQFDLRAQILDQTKIKHIEEKIFMKLAGARAKLGLLTN